MACIPQELKAIMKMTGKEKGRGKVGTAATTTPTWTGKDFKEYFARSNKGLGTRKLAPQCGGAVAMEEMVVHDREAQMDTPTVAQEQMAQLVATHRRNPVVVPVAGTVDSARVRVMAQRPAL